MHQGLTIAEAAEQTGLTADTLRYYEKDGLMLRSVPRGASGHRQYAQADIDWIQLITKLRSKFKLDPEVYRQSYQRLRPQVERPAKKLAEAK